MPWQNRLAAHFTELSEDRKRSSVSYPTYALEHGLSVGERDELSATVRDQITKGPPDWEAPLPWIVYATEVGYRYSGDEYWQTFEDETPGWLARGSRNWVRQVFRDFKRKYGGAEPSGQWAGHFSIICWPITHAILPEDLQRQLARILYDIRHIFTADLFASPVSFGEAIGARSWQASSRFRQLAQEKQLLGQIATGLLLETEGTSPGLIHPATLRRIAADLERERQGREWLATARTTAIERTSARGLARVPLRSASGGERRDPLAEVAALGIEPQLMLRPVDAAGTTWIVLLEIPDLSHLAVRFPAAREILMETRCTVAGAVGHPLARSSLVGRSRQVQLARWPLSNEVLLKFERSDPQFEYLLRTECMLRPSPDRLFRIATDGRAYEQRSLRVRAGESYVLVRTDAPIAYDSYARPTQVQCEGVSAASLQIPAAISEDWERVLKELSITLARGLEVWPAGVAAASWDGAGRADWMQSERPCLAVQCDHDVESLLISLDATDERVEVAPVAAGVPVFVEMEPLAVGAHTLRVAIRERGSPAPTPLGTLAIEMRVREQPASAVGLAPTRPLVAEVDPASATLEDLWDGRVSIEVQGPRERAVIATVVLYRRENGEALVSTKLPSMVLPISPDQWRSHFARHFREARSTQEKYDLARGCRIELSAEELGRITLQFERTLAPLRWIVRHTKSSASLCLIDDTADSPPPVIEHRRFDSPITRSILPLQASYDLHDGGGLFVATREGASISIVTAPPVRRPSDLACIPVIPATDRSPEAVKSLVDAAVPWRQARPSGSVVGAWNQRRVLRAITYHVMRSVCGSVWGNAESALDAGGHIDLRALKLAVSHNKAERGIAAALALDLSGLAESTVDARITRLAELISSFHLITTYGSGGSKTLDARWLAEFSLRLASDPATIPSWAPKHATLGVDRLMSTPTVARAARFLVLAIDEHRDAETTSGELYSTWAWT